MIILGAGVTHPEPRDDKGPSIGAVSSISCSVFAVALSVEQPLEFRDQGFSSKFYNPNDPLSIEFLRTFHMDSFLGQAAHF